MKIIIEEDFNPQSKDAAEISISLKLVGEVEIKNMGRIILAARTFFNENPGAFTPSIKSFLESIESRYNVL